MPNRDPDPKRQGIKDVRGRRKQRKWDLNNIETAIKEGRITRKDAMDHRKKVAAEVRAKGTGAEPVTKGRNLKQASGKYKMPTTPKRSGAAYLAEKRSQKARRREIAGNYGSRSRGDSTDDDTPTLRRGT